MSSIELITSGRPCQICARRDPADKGAIKPYPPGDYPSQVELDPSNVKVTIRVDEEGNPYNVEDHSQTGRVQKNVRDNIVYRIVEKFFAGTAQEEVSHGEFCVRCIKGAAEAAEGTPRRGVDVLKTMLGLSKGAKRDAEL